ncbi:MAG: VWA domain-containing protein [Verrucomicrobiaceae bacterium]|nr:MAG: VWA domain-containing protein [Verrucomicrobiaceae bacterium]
MEKASLTFAWPQLLPAAAAAVAVLLLVHAWTAKRGLRRLQGVVAPRLRDQLLRSVSFGRRWIKAVTLALATALLIGAIARPQGGFQTVTVDRSTVDFLIGLDLSRSMLAEDMNGKSRLEAAKESTAAFLDRLGADRVGLLAFAGEAFIAAPITQDHEAVKRNLAALSTSSVARQGSDLGKAIQLALKTFETGKYETKALVLITDGEQLQGDALIAARDAARKGLRIYTVGAGSINGARIPPEPETGVLGFARNAQFYVSGYNLFSIDNYLGWDPEVTAGQGVFSRGYDFGNYPLSRSFMAGIKIGL